ncbi:MAG: hypothetical protein LH617_08945 [Ramlibacter sp.]|nr:hypothetical protein [Ramlibacter sp.]
MNTPSTKSLRTSASSYGDDAVNSAESALESTRQLASQVLERAGEKVRDLRYGARDLAGKGLSAATDATAAAQRQLSRYADVTGRYVSEQPVKSILIGVAAGAAIAALVVAARRRNRY